MKHDEKKVLKAPADMDTGAGTSYPQSYYYNIIHKEMEDVLKNESDDPRSAIKKLCTVVAQQLDNMDKDRETEKKLSNKDNENLRIALTAEIKKIASDLELKISALDVKTEKRFSEVEKRFSEMREAFNAQRTLLILTFLGVILSGLGVLDKVRVLLGL